MVKSNFLSEFRKDPLLSIFDFSIRCFGGKKQFLPKMSELESEGIAELLENLKGKSEKETLSNLLEWQDRNIIFWSDRMYFSLILYVLILISVCLFPVNHIVKIAFAVALILVWIINFTLMLSYVVASVAMSLILISWVFSVNPLQAQKFYSVTNLVTLSLILGAFLSLISYLFPKYFSLKSRIPGFKLNDTFSISLRVNKIIKYRLAVCRDYAKLTAVLLYNLFPNNPIYFISIPRHVAAGIEINGMLYILDQKLPVMTLDGWLRIWNRKTATIYQLKILESEGKRKLELEKRGIAKLKDHSTRINIERLTEEVVKLIGIKQVDYGGGAVAKIPLLKLIKCYEDDEIVTYSMARTIKFKLENELCSNFENIGKIEIKQDGEDLITFAYLRNNN